MQIPVIAGQDLTDNERKVVFLDAADANKAKVATGDTLATAHGILVRGGADDSVVTVEFGPGCAQAIAGGAIVHGDELMATSTGKVVKATSGKSAIGRYMYGLKGNSSPTVADGDWVNIQLYERHHTTA